MQVLIAHSCAKLAPNCQVYISPVFAGHPKLEGPWPSVLRASGQAHLCDFFSLPVTNSCALHNCSCY